MGIAAVPEPEPLDREHRRTEVAFGLRQVLWLHQQDHVDVGEPHVFDGARDRIGDPPRLLLGDLERGHEPAADFDERRIDGPREIVHVALLVHVSGRAVAVLAPRHPHAGRAEHHVRRHRHLDAVVAEVRVELRVRVELMAVPAAGGAATASRGLVDAQLREPLADERVIADVAGACEHAWQLRGEGDVEGDARSGRDRFWQCHSRHRPILRVAIVWRLESQRAGEIGAVGQDEAGDVDPAPAVLLDRDVAELAARFLPEGRAGVLERVQIEVEPEIGDRIGGGIPPGDTLTAGEPLRGAVQRDADVIGDDLVGALGQGVGVGDGCSGRRQQPGNRHRRDQRRLGAHRRGLYVGAGQARL